MRQHAECVLSATIDVVYPCCRATETLFGSPDVCDIPDSDYTFTMELLSGAVPLFHRFEVEGQRAGSHAVIEALSMQLMDERAGRFEKVGTWCVSYVGV